MGYELCYSADTDNSFVIVHDNLEIVRDMKYNGDDKFNMYR